MAVVFLYADDYLFFAGGKKWMECIAYPLFLLRALGVPFSWTKLSAGFVVGWIGLEVNVKEGSLGLSARRAAWVTGWLEAKVAAGKVQIGELVQALGRMQFAYGVLRWDRPFIVLPQLEARAAAFYRLAAEAPRRRRIRPTRKPASLRETDPW